MNRFSDIMDIPGLRHEGSVGGDASAVHIAGGEHHLEIRPERHVADSIATLRIHLARALAKRLPRCPCCQRTFMTQ